MPTFGLFGVIWTAIAIVITVSSGYNVFSEKGIAIHEILIEEEEKEKDSYFNNKKENIEDRLRKIQHLYDSGLITAEEYEKKKKEILDEI